MTLPVLERLPAAYAALVRSTGLSGASESLLRALLAGLVVLPTAVLIGALLIQGIDPGPSFDAELCSRVTVPAGRGR